MPDRSVIVASLTIAASAAACAAEDAPSFRASIEPICVEAAPDDADVWVCPETIEVACDDLPDSIYVVPEDAACESLTLASIEGPFAPGQHTISIVDDANDALVCEAELIVTDDQPPQIVTRRLEMWPPNHKLHMFVLEDCFEEVLECDPQWDARVRFIASDEPEDAMGDGHSRPDIVNHGPREFALRSERQGGGDGRVYTVGWEVRDSSGNVAEGECHVDVPHDRSGRPAGDDGEAYRVEWPE